jgi:hypothetical protein
MTEVPAASSTQPSILIFFTSVKAAKTAITVKDASGAVVASYTPTKQYSSVAISAPNLKIGETYTLYSGNTKVNSFKITGSVTYLDESGVTAKPQTKGPGGR